jgi:hypothetical protein
MEKSCYGGEIMEWSLQQVIGVVLVGVSMFFLGYGVAYMQMIKKLLQLLKIIEDDE